MALERGARPLAICLRCTRHKRITLPIRSFSSSPATLQETEAAPSTKPQLDAFGVVTPREERRLLREQGLFPVGPRRRRAAMRTSAGIPFAELPYQCFQEARQFLQEDVKEKLDMIRVQRERIQRLKEQLPAELDQQNEETRRKMHQLKSMRAYLEHLKILADSNDPLIKKRYEDGEGDMNKPIYRHYADREWRSYKRKVLVQRIEQMNVIPDVLPQFEPTLATSLSFPPPPDSGTRARNVQHGDIVDSRVSEVAPDLEIKRFQKGEKLYTIAVINPDVPNVSRDTFENRCHFLACNIPISPTQSHVSFSGLSADTQVVLPWLPAYAQKGLPYQRMSILILEQPPVAAFDPVTGDEPASKTLDIGEVKKAKKGDFTVREGFSLREFTAHFKTPPVGVDLFRTEWDEGTAGVMQRAGLIGHDVEFKRKRIEPLPYKRLKEERFR